VSLAALNYQAAHELFKRNSQSTQIIINVHGYFHASLYAPNEIQERIEITRNATRSAIFTFTARCNPVTYDSDICEIGARSSQIRSGRNASISSILNDPTIRSRFRTLLIVRGGEQSRSRGALLNSEQNVARTR